MSEATTEFLARPPSGHPGKAYGPMWGLAARNLSKERVRLAISVAGVAFAVLLMVLLRGLFVAYESKVGDHFRAIGADAWVLQRGTADFFHSFSVLPDELRAGIEEVDGVARARPYIARQVGFTLHGEETLLYLSAFDPADPVTGPRALERGTLDVGSDGIVVDRVFASQAGVDLGDVLTLNGRDLEIVGVGSGGDMVMFQYAYVSTETARDVLEMPGQVNAVLVELAPSVDPRAVTDGIEARSSPLVSVSSTDEVVARNQRVINEGFLPVIAVLLGIGFLVGVVVIGLTIYSAVVEKRREYGVLKALGAGGGQLTHVVVSQAVYSAAGGYVLGVVLANLASAAATRWVPEFVTDLRILDVAAIGGAAALMAVVASAMPLSRLRRIDPAEAFRG